MGRHAEGWKLRWKRGVAQVRFTDPNTHERCEVSTGETDPARARERAAGIYAATIAGRAHSRRRPLSPHASLDTLVAGWLVAIEHTLDGETVTAYRQYSRKWRERWSFLDQITDATLAEFVRERVVRVLRTSVRKELAALLGSFFGWLEEQRVVTDEMIPRRPKFLAKTPGVRSGPQRSRRVEATPAEVRRFLMAVPEWGGKGSNRWRARDALTVAYETGLRPKTIARLSVPEHYAFGATHLTIEDRIDKARFGRRVPLSVIARRALERSAPKRGVIFGAHDYRDIFRTARALSDAPDGFSPYDIRHARGQHLTDAGAPLTGVAYLLGHKQITTTNRYVRAQEREAAETLRYWGRGDDVPRKAKSTGPGRRRKVQ